MRFRRGLVGLVIVGVMGGAAHGGAVDAAGESGVVPERVGRPPALADDRPFDGSWDSTFGRMDLYQSGDSVVGRYGLTGSLSGSVQDGRLSFRYVEPTASGEGWFEASEAGTSLEGEWRIEGGDDWRRWTATSLAPADPGFFGLWETSFGKLRLVPDGDRVLGCYDLGSGARVEGEITGGRVTLAYTEPDGTTGEAWFELSEDGGSIIGKWRASGSQEWGDWVGTRLIPDPRRVYLVVLEADWEADLQDREFAFGEMLRSYFTMSLTSHVEVRVRTFMDAADLERWCAEVAYIPEPVVLLFSTHGSEEGITVRGESIGPEAIAGAIGHAPNVGLVHLSGCAMAAGSVPRLILRALPGAVRAPISGYATNVAWDTSALADFTYLTLLLARGMDPQTAAAQAILASPYIGGESADGSVLAPLGLRVFAPAP